MGKAEPDMLMPPGVEMKRRIAVLQHAVVDAADAGFTPEGVEELPALVLGTHVQALRRALGGDRRMWSPCW